METETYKLEVFCKNCNFEGEITIPKGMTLVETHCHNCKLKMLDKKLPRARMTPRRINYR